MLLRCPPEQTGLIGGQYIRTAFAVPFLPFYKLYTVPNSKPTLRKHFLDMRKGIKGKDASAAAAKAAYNFIQLSTLQNTKIIAIYQPLHNEISLEPLVDSILYKYKNNEITFCLPVVAAKESPLLFYPWKPGDTLANNTIYPQLFEPQIKKTPIFPDLIIVPLVAFDENCHRLGYGAGFYDRTIKWLNGTGGEYNNLESPKNYYAKHGIKKPLTIGYAYDCQKSESFLPTDPHDVKLDFIVTDKDIYKAG